MKKRLHTSPALAAALLLFVGPELSRAATNSYLWNGSAENGDWFDADNWNLDALPGSTQSGETYDFATIPDTITSGTINYTPGSGAPTVFDRLVVASSVSSGGLTLNFNGDITTTHVENTGADTFGTNRNRLTVNFNSGTYTAQDGSIQFYGTGTTTIGSGATVISNAGTKSYHNNNTTIVINAHTVVHGTLATRSTTLESTLYGNTSLKLSQTLDIDGGTLLVDGIRTTSNTGDGNGDLIIRNGGAATIRYGSSDLRLGGNNNANYSNSITISSGGSFTNRTSMAIGYHNDNRSTWGGTTTALVEGEDSRWMQGGAAYVGSGRVGLLTVKDQAVFEAKSDLTIGGGVTSSHTAPGVGIDAYGVLTVDGGTVSASNELAGQRITAGTAGTFGGSSGSIYFGSGDDSWDQTWQGQRVVFESLRSGGAGLSTGTVYHAAEITSGSGTPPDTRSHFGLAASPLGTVFSGSGYTNYESGTGENVYYTLGSRLVIGSEMTFGSGVTRDIAGTLNMESGRLIADELIANRGAGVSTIVFNGGEMVIGNTYRNATITGGLAATGAAIDTGGALQIGDGIGAVGSATYRMNGGTHAIAHGMALADDGQLAGFGTLVATVSGSGSVAPGSATERTALISANAVDGGSGLDFHFEMTLPNSLPVFSNPSASGNDVLRLDGETPFVTALSGGNTVNLYFSTPELAAGDLFLGGFYTDAGNTLGAIENAGFGWFIEGDGNGTHSYNGLSYYTLAEYNALLGSDFSFALDMVQSPFDFGGGVTDGYLTRFTAVPEPGSLMLAGLGALAWWGLRRRRNP